MTTDQTIYDQVSSHYGNAARSNGDLSYSAKIATAFGYSAQDLEGMPEEANLGLSCGNPIALAGLSQGEVVVDLGSGAGFDVFQAASKVGTTGKAIGVDFNKDMLAKANKIQTQRSGMENCSFIESKITSIPDLKDASVDCVISNCVINLVPDAEKHLVFHEMFRILKPGGRVAVSDILAKKPMPEDVKQSMALYVGCIAGASQLDEYEKWLKDAGFRDILIVDAKSDLNVYGQTDGGEGPCCGPTPTPAKDEEESSSCCKPAKEDAKSSSCCKPAKEEAETSSSCCAPKSNEPALSNGEQMAKFRNVDFNQFAGSYKIYAVKS